MTQLVVDGKLDLSTHRWKTILDITGENSLIGFNCNNCLQQQLNSKNEMSNLMSEKKISDLKYYESLCSDLSFLVKRHNISSGKNENIPTENKNASNETNKIIPDLFKKLKPTQPTTELPSNSNNDIFQNMSHQDVEHEKIYSIHVSKFPAGTTTSDISEMIISKSKVKNPNLFNVEMVFNRKFNFFKRKYNSFKISTLKKSLFEEIMKDEIWNPLYTARMFEDRSGMKKVKVFSQTKQRSKPDPKLSSKAPNNKKQRIPSEKPKHRFQEYHLKKEIIIHAKMITSRIDITQVKIQL